MESHALAAVELPDVLTCKRKNLWMIILLRTFTSTYIVRICLSIMVFLSLANRTAAMTVHMLN